MNISDLGYLCYSKVRLLTTPFLFGLGFCFLTWVFFFFLTVFCLFFVGFGGGAFFCYNITRLRKESRFLISTLPLNTVPFPTGSVSIRRLWKRIF